MSKIRRRADGMLETQMQRAERDTFTDRQAEIARRYRTDGSVEAERVRHRVREWSGRYHVPGSEPGFFAEVWVAWVYAMVATGSGWIGHRLSDGAWWGWPAGCAGLAVFAAVLICGEHAQRS